MSVLTRCPQCDVPFNRDGACDLCSLDLPSVRACGKVIDLMAALKAALAGGAPAEVRNASEVDPDAR